MKFSTHTIPTEIIWYAVIVLKMLSWILLCLFVLILYRTLDTIQIPFELGDELAVLICNSNVRHELSHSEYPTRRKQCAQALELMRLNSYKDATIKSLDGKHETQTKPNTHNLTSTIFVCKSQKCAAKSHGKQKQKPTNRVNWIQCGSSL